MSDGVKVEARQTFGVSVSSLEFPCECRRQTQTVLGQIATRIAPRSSTPGKLHFRPPTGLKNGLLCRAAQVTLPAFNLDVAAPHTAVLMTNPPDLRNINSISIL